MDVQKWADVVKLKSQWVDEPGDQSHLKSLNRKEITEDAAWGGQRWKVLGTVRRTEQGGQAEVPRRGQSNVL